MLDHLLETGARTKKSPLGIVASSIAHGAVVCLAVVGTLHAKPGPAATIRETPILIPTFTPQTNHPVGSQGATSVGAAQPDVPRIPVPAPIDIGTPALPAFASGSADPDILGEIAGSHVGPATSPVSTGAPSGSAQLDTPVRILDERVPAYPPSLRSAGITGVVTAQFVVDTIGRVEPSSLRVLSATHQLFAQSVAASLRYARFSPGEVSGRKVRTLVERSFRFDIAGAR